MKAKIKKTKGIIKFPEFVAIDETQITERFCLFKNFGLICNIHCF